VDNPQELTHISLCSGYGGIDLGLKRAIGSIRTIAYSEIESFVCSNLVAKMEAGLLDVAPIWTNLKTFPWGHFRGRVDILSGGFPCQPFSSAGRRAGDEDPRHLWPHILRGIRELGRPPIVFFENVEGIISSKLAGTEWSDPTGTPVLLHVLRELERVGYRATAGLFSATEVGAPHQRKRVFILGVQSCLDSKAFDVVLRGAANITHREDVEDTDNDRCGTRSKSSDERGTTLERGRESVPTRRLRQADDASVSSRADGRTELQTLGDTQYDGHTPPTLPRSIEETSHKRGENREDFKRKSEGASMRVPLGNAWPAGRGASQHPWEPPRVTKPRNNNPLDDGDDPLDDGSCEMGDTHTARWTPNRRDNGGVDGESREEEGRGDQSPPPPQHGGTLGCGEPSPSDEGSTQPSMGGNPHGIADRLGYAELSITCDNRNDELRMLGNGVVPATAERAFRVLWQRLI